MIALKSHRILQPVRRLAGVLLLGMQVSSGKPGDLDKSFDSGPASAASFRAAVMDGEGRVVAGGGFTTFNGTPAPRLVRLLDNGRIDPTFAIGEGADGEVKAIQMLANGRILVSGQFKHFAGKPVRGLVVLNPDGSVDPRFVSRFEDDGFSVGVTCVELLPDGRLVVGGYFTRYAGKAVGRYVILRANGELDTESPQKGGADSHVLDIDLLPDGSILLGGFFRELDGLATACVGRLHPDGSVDTAFRNSAGKGSVAYAVAGQADGKIIAGGAFKSSSGDGRRVVGRLTATGELDASFAANDALDGNVHGLTIDRQGRILVAGGFNKFRGTPMPGMGRLLADGRPDPSFLLEGEVSPSFIQEYPVDPAGRIIAYGWSRFPGRKSPPSICRLLGGEKGE